MKIKAIVPLMLVGCLDVDCEKLKTEHLRQECIIVVEKPPKESVWFEVEGYHPETKKKCKCKSSNRWWSQYSKEIKKGDTIMKKKGELIFSILKTDTILNHNWECKGKKYGKTMPDVVVRKGILPKTQ